MANVSIVKLKVRRGTDLQRKQVILDQGELGFTTDTQRLFVGDGATLGGLCPAIKFYTVSQAALSASPLGSAAIQIGDIVYDTVSTSFWTLTGTPNTSWASYSILPILTPFNARTLLPTTSASLQPGSIWIQTATTIPSLSGTPLSGVGSFLTVV